ncbi:hypothetical protein JHK87_009702 [Glycine soja]|nr:hypothetical protein JHK87_009702 [Glycine soja]
MPHLDTRLCMLLCVIPLVGDLIEEEEERKPVDEKDNGPTDYWKEKKVAGKCRDDLVLSLQVLGDYQSLLTPPQSVLAAAKAMLFVSGITIGSAYFDCLNMTEMPQFTFPIIVDFVFDIWWLIWSYHEYLKLKARFESLQRTQRNLLGEDLGPLNTKDLEQLEHQLDSSLKQVRSTKSKATLCVSNTFKLLFDTRAYVGGSKQIFDREGPSGPGKRELAMALLREICRDACCKLSHGLRHFPIQVEISHFPTYRF